MMAKMNDLTHHNNPPDMAVTAEEVANDLNAFLGEHPVIENEDDARAAKLLMDRGRLCIADLEDERAKKVKPHRETIDGINGHYKRPKTILESVLSGLRDRVTAYIRKEEAKRIEAAREAARIAEDAQRKLDAARLLEQEALGASDSGELGVDLKAAVVATDSANRDAAKAAREATRASKQTHIKLGGGIGKAAALREKETYTVVDAVAALHDMGTDDDIDAAIIKKARSYYRLHKKVPEGVTRTTEDRV
jgi:hypothetical protein